MRCPLLIALNVGFVFTLYISGCQQTTAVPELIIVQDDVDIYDGFDDFFALRKPNLPDVPQALKGRLLDETTACSNILSVSKPDVSTLVFTAPSSNVGIVTKTMSEFTDRGMKAYQYKEVNQFEKIDGIFSRQYLVTPHAIKLVTDSLEGRQWIRQFSTSPADTLGEGFAKGEVRRIQGIETERILRLSPGLSRPYYQTVRFDGCAQSSAIDFPEPTSVWTVQESRGIRDATNVDRFDTDHLTLHLEYSKGLGWYIAITDGSGELYKLSEVVR